MAQLTDLDNIAEDKVVYDKDWTQGSVVRILWHLSWPLMIGASLNQIGPTIDMIWVGRLSAAAIAGVGVGGMAVMMNSVLMALAMGSRAIIARYIGARNEAGIATVIPYISSFSGLLRNKDVLKEGSTHER